MIEVLLAGVAAGIVAGLLGVGGGVLFVPALVILLGHTQLSAEATSLLAIVPVAAAGAWNQSRYGNVRFGDGLLLGALAVPGAAAGVALANAVPERALEVGFAVFMLGVAASLLRRVSNGE